ncbi:DgaE family pyridoxal phosphate-dependent ammonia lyase [Cohnella zeiphila]|uniref:DgaE family pyridoxal phosphate-dependent ammonia lyase n=1 Tax=Cohnella zeiphila TaxID=2761120 RepID=A0A7X0STR0_9BACL|nr:DgaE family pyridoxal phosphate-dependent ammonia lyase [Cohnella zeiphila]MBB6735946.1 DgaE family pyridoxal phosphate-dependent ammonia lyase [Cohnella zeiphila]
MGSSLLAKYGLKRVVNASGRMSILGVSAPTDTVMAAMKEGGQRYVEIADLVDKAGDHIAGALGAEAAVVVNSASSGIALSVAGIVTRGDRRRSERLHRDPIERNEIVMLKGHNVQYGAPVETMIYLGGGELVEAGYANEGRKEHIEEAIGERTAAILYVKSHHCVQKNMISVEDAWEVAQRRCVPLIVDAAAEEDLQKYVRVSDLAIYSGSKAIEGPTSGIVAGKRPYIEWVKTQLHGIGRSMKVGKEATFGLLQALDEYADKPSTHEREKQALQELLPLAELPGIEVSIVRDEAGREISRGRIRFDAARAGVSAREAADRLREGDIAIYTRDYGVMMGYFDIDPRSLQGDDMQVIAAAIRAIATGGNGHVEHG